MNQVDCTPTGEESPIELTEREIQMREMEMKRLFEDRAAMMAATDRFDLPTLLLKNIWTTIDTFSQDVVNFFTINSRDMHNWWAEYDILMANYRAMFADNVCHNPDMLNASLLIIEAKIEKVTFDTQK